MCKVVKYWFACHHGYRLQHSRCGGTKHKSTRSGLATACRSEPYLAFVFAFDCGPCQHQSFEDGWKLKLGLAETFLAMLKQKCLPGVRNVEALVEQLNEDFNSASWNTRTLYPHAHRECAVRPSLGQFHKALSPLSREVLPEDIPEPLQVIGPDHPNYEYDWDYVASTDPIHPVDTNYAHPLDEIDPSWTLGHLSPGEFEQSGEGVGFDTSEADTAWGSSLVDINARPTNCVEDSPAWTHDDAAPEESFGGATALKGQIKRYVEDEDLLSGRVDMVIQFFWSVVNGIPASNQSSQTTISILGDDQIDAFQSFYLSNIHTNAETPKTGLLTPPPTPPGLSTDGSLDFDASTLTSPSPSVDSPSLLPMNIGPQSSFAVSQFAAASRPKPSSYSDTRRQHLTSMENADRVRCSSELLHLSRCEIKTAEGPNGRRSVVHPQLPRDRAARTGWWK